MTGATADRFGLKDRGYIRPGAYADLTIFDKDEIAESPGAERPLGIKYVFINGELALENGAYLGKRPGRILKKETFK